MTAKAAQILLVEDNPGDIELIREALRSGKILNDLHVVEDGFDALAFLRQQGRFVGMPMPDLVLLDINLPRKSGHEVLAEIRADPEFKTMPVIILTTSDLDKDILQGYQHHVNAYVTKPALVADFFEAVKTIEQFWLTLVKLPSDAVSRPNCP